MIRRSWRFPSQGFREEAQQIEDVVGVALAEQPPKQAVFEVFQDVGEVGLVTLGFGFRQALVGGGRQSGDEVGGEDLGVEILADGIGELAGELLHEPSLFQEFEGFLDAPPGLVQAGKRVGGKGAGIQQ